MRRLVTRLLAIIPSMAVALVVGRRGIDNLLVVSQVVLSIVLPFITLPLLYCTSNRSMMSARKTKPVEASIPVGSSVTEVSAIPKIERSNDDENADSDEVVDYSNNMLTVAVGAGIWLVILAANMYVIVELCIGKS